MGSPFTTQEAAVMRRALQLAARGGRHTSPNPQVGCVVLDGAGSTVGEGWHREVGGAHAEVEALRRAGDAARGGTAVVTLEPCDHTGRTGPCTRALREAGIARVVYAVADPMSHADVNPVRGAEPMVGTAGARTLATAGIEVAGGLLADEAVALNREWFLAARNGRPYVTYKYAATLDGRIAAADGSSRWISSPQSRADVHRLRAESDAVLVGAGTARADDPQLAVRDIPGARQPLRVVADTDATAVRSGTRVLDDTAPTLIAVAEDVADGALTHLDGVADVLRVPRASSGGLRPDTLLGELYRLGVVRLLLEGGPTLAGSMIRAGVVDRVVGYLAPAFLGAGPAAVGDAGIGTLTDATRLQLVDSVSIGTDLRITADVLPTRPTPEPASRVSPTTATTETDQYAPRP